MSGKYSASHEKVESSGIAPTMFKSLIGKGHQDFSTSTQQDAQEFFLHVLNTLTKHSLNQANPADAFKFKVEDRVECGVSGKVKYAYRDEWSLSLNIPLQAATNIEEVRAYEAKVTQAQQEGVKVPPEDIVRPKIPLDACLATFLEVETVDQFFSSAINDKTFAKKTTRLATMPDYLMIQLKKFTLREDWTEVKLDVAMDIPDVLDLSKLRGVGLQPNEQELPETTVKPPSPPPADPAVMTELMSMGFPGEACKKALFFSKNSGIEAAMQWIMEHMGDNDFDAPFVPPGTESSNKSSFVPNPEGLMMLTSMGFSEIQATKALKETNNNTERAVDWIFSHQDELILMADNGAGEPMDQAPIEPSQYRDGSPSKCFLLQLFLLKFASLLHV